MKCGDCYWYKKECGGYAADMEACPCYCETSATVYHIPQIPEDLNDTEKTIIREYANQNMNITATARKLNYHRNTIVYHIEAVSRKTMLDPMNFRDLVKLIRMIGDEP